MCERVPSGLLNGFHAFCPERQGGRKRDHGPVRTQIYWVGFQLVDGDSSWEQKNSKKQELEVKRSLIHAPFLGHQSRGSPEDKRALSVEVFFVHLEQQSVKMGLPPYTFSGKGGAALLSVRVHGLWVNVLVP